MENSGLSESIEALKLRLIQAIIQCQDVELLRQIETLLKAEAEKHQSEYTSESVDPTLAEDIKGQNAYGIRLPQKEVEDGSLETGKQDPNKTIGFKTDGSPLTLEEMKARIEKSREEGINGDYVTVEDLEERLESWT